MKTLLSARTHLIHALVIGTLLVAAPVLSAEAPDRLDNASLKQMLENMGYEIHKSGTYKSGTPWYQLKFNEGGSDYYIVVSLTHDQKTLWVIANLTNLADGQDLPRNVAITMLDHNYDDSTYTYFAYNVEDRHLRLKSSVPNRSVKPVALRALIRETVETLKSERTLWEPDNWPKDAAPKNAAPQ